MAEKKVEPAQDAGLVTVFIKEDPMLKDRVVYGSINEKDYVYTRGTTQKVPAHVADHMIQIGQAMRMD